MVLAKPQKKLAEIDESASIQGRGSCSSACLAIVRHVQQPWRLTRWTRLAEPEAHKCTRRDLGSSGNRIVRFSRSLGAAPRSSLLPGPEKLACIRRAGPMNSPALGEWSRICHAQASRHVGSVCRFSARDGAAFIINSDIHSAELIAAHAWVINREGSVGHPPSFP